MCGRFAFWNDKNTIVQHYQLNDAASFYTGYNIVPSYTIAIIRKHNDGSRELANTHWGLIPQWAKDTKLKPANARAEGVASKPWFRDAFRNRRCLIPANGYYEWSELNGPRQPWFIRLKDKELFSFAGIWSRRETPDSIIESCALITTEPNPYLVKIHDRMPVILSPDRYDEWLDRGGEAMLQPYAGEMEAWTVSTLVNNPKHQGPELISPIPSILNPAI